MHAAAITRRNRAPSRRRTRNLRPRSNQEWQHEDGRGGRDESPRVAQSYSRTSPPHTKLLYAVWGPEYVGQLEYLRTCIRMLRRKVEDAPARPEYILTEPRIGYRFQVPAA
jgi:Transcriptional regulatory protein, C terminal